MNVNQVNIQGTIKTDPNLVTLANDFKVLNFNILFLTSKKNKDTQKYENEFNYIRVSLLGTNANYWNGKLKKDDKVVISGSLKHEMYKDKNNNDVNNIKIIVETLNKIFTDDSAHKTSSTNSSHYQSSTKTNTESSSFEDDIPF